MKIKNVISLVMVLLFTILVATATPTPTTSLNVVSGTQGINNWYVSNVLFNLSCVDNVSGCNSSYYYLKSDKDSSTLNNGTPSGGVTIEDGAMVFDGVNGYVVIGNVINNTNPQTISMWVKKSNNDNFPATDQFRFFTQEYIYFSGRGEGLRFGTGTNDVISTNKLSYPFNNWNLLTGVWNGSSLIFYVNGNLIDSKNTSLVTTNTVNRNHLGGVPAQSRYFNGSIDQPLIFNRALNESEITQIYNAGRSSYSPITDGLVFQASGRDIEGNSTNVTKILDTNYITAFSDDIELSTEGTDTVFYGSVNNGGLMDLNNQTFSIDKTNPITTLNIVSGTERLDGWYTSNVVFNLSSSDSLSGINKTYYCIDNINTCTPTTEYSSSVTVTKLGNNYVRYYSMDNSGNNETVNSELIEIDRINITNNLNNGLVLYLPFNGTVADYSTGVGYSQPNTYWNGMVAGYDFKFDQNANDITGFGNDGNVSGATLTSEGYSFDGVDDYINKDSFVLNPNTNGITWSINVKPINVFKDYIIFSKTNLLIDDWDYGISGGLNSYNSGCTMYNSTGTEKATTQKVLTQNQETMITCSYDSNTKVLTQYIDGIYHSQVTVGTARNIYDNLYIGTWRPGRTTTLNGTISEVLIYDRALSATEIAELYEYSQANIKVRHHVNQTITPNITYTSDVKEQDDMAMGYDGVSENSYTKISNQTNLINNQNQLSTSYWIKTNDNNGVHISKHVGGFDGSFYQWISNDMFRFMLINSSDNRVDCDVNATHLLNNEYHHILTTYNGNIMNIYFNGILTHSCSQTGNIKTSNINFGIGNFMNSVNNPYKYNGSIDEVRIYNRTLSEDEIWELYTHYDYHKPAVTIHSPINQNYNTENILINFSTDNFYDLDSCFYTTDNSLSTTPVSCTVPFTATDLVEGNNTIHIYVQDVEGWIGHETVSFWLDTVNPIITSNFANNTKYLPTQNITGQFNFSDDNLYRWNVTLNGVQIDGDISVAYTDYIYNLSVDIDSLNAGKHTLVVEIADGHTAKEINDYQIKTGGLFDNSFIEFYTGENKIKVQAADKMFLDKFEAEKHKDRYKFSFKPSENKVSELVYKEASETLTQMVKQTFLVEAQDKIYIIDRPGSEYNKWIISGNNWIDFLGEGIYNEYVEIVLINDYTAEVTVYHSPDLDIIKFESIGDINIVTNTYTFYTTKVDIDYISPIITETPQQIIVKVNATNNSYAFANVSAVLKYNDVTQTLTKTFVNEIFTFTSSLNSMSTLVNTDANISVDIIYSDIGTAQINETQSISALFLTTIPGNETCPVNYTQALTIFGYDEGTPDTPVVFEANIAFDILSSGVVYRSLGQALSGHSNYTLCLFPETANIEVNAWIEYKATNYSDRKYFLQNYALNNQTNTLNLYLLDDIITSDIIIKVFDKNKGTPLQEAMVKVQRYYPQFANESTAAYRTVEIGKTDANGETLSKLVLGDVWYRFIVEYPAGTIVYTGDVERVLTVNKDLPVSLISGSLVKYNELLDMNGQVTYNPTTQTFTYIWSNPTNTDVTGILRIYQDTGVRQILVYETSAVSASATLAYQIPGNITNERYIGKGYIVT